MWSGTRGLLSNLFQTLKKLLINDKGQDILISTSRVCSEKQDVQKVRLCSPPSPGAKHAVPVAKPQPS